MPRITDDILHCSVFLYPSEEDATKGRMKGASGFLVGVPRMANTKNAPDPIHSDHIYVVSNAHVITDAKCAKITKKDGASVVVCLSGWSEPLSPYDLAIHLLKHAELPYAARSLFYIHSDLLVTSDLIDSLNLGIGDEVFMVGRLFQDIEEPESIPTVRFGHVACPLAKRECFNGEEFLIECRSINGYSGSPVFLEISSRQRDFFKDQLRGCNHLLLGVNSGHTAYLAKLEQNDKIVVPIDSGMAKVIPAWVLSDLLADSRVVQERAAIEAGQ
jgi:hypothetical protein